MSVILKIGLFNTLPFKQLSERIAQKTLQFEHSTFNFLSWIGPVYASFHSFQYLHPFKYPFISIFIMSIDI